MFTGATIWILTHGHLVRPLPSARTWLTVSGAGPEPPQRVLEGRTLGHARVQELVQRTKGHSISLAPSPEPFRLLVFSGSFHLTQIPTQTPITAANSSCRWYCDTTPCEYVEK